MLPNLIDLRKTPELSPPPKSSETPPPATLPQGVTPLLCWIAKEYEIHEYSQKYILGIGGIVLFLLIIGIVTTNYFFIVFVILAFFVIMMYGKHTPREFTFAIAEEGIYLGKKYYSWKSLKSFWIFERLNPAELSLETEAMLNPYIRIPINNEKPEKIREIMKQFLPEKEHTAFLTDEIARRIGF